MKTALVFAVAGLLLAPSAAPAQQVKLVLQSGRVTLDAQNVPVRQILTEWARIGGVNIVNGDKVTGPPVTLHLADMSESQALDVILRGVAGYMLAPRPPDSRGASAYDRILILAVSTAPKNLPAAMQPSLPRIAPLQADIDTDPQTDGPAMTPVRRPPFVNGAVAPRPPVAPTEGDDAQREPPQAPTAAPPPSPGYPFGAVGSGLPGVIAPAPQNGQEPNRR